MGVFFCIGISHAPQIGHIGVRLNLGGSMNPHIDRLKVVNKYSAGVILSKNKSPVFLDLNYKYF